MKILFIAPLPPPITGHSLASKIFFDELTKLHQIEVINLSKNSFKSGVNSFERIMQIFNIIKEVWYKKKDVDVIYLTISESFAGNIKDILIYLLCFKIISRMIIHVHGGTIIRLFIEKSNLLLRVNKFFYQRLGAIIVLGKTHFDVFSKFVRTSTLHVVPNFAEDYLFISEEEIKDKYKNIDHLNILFLSNLIQGKGYNELLDAYLALDSSLRRRIEIDFAGGFESEGHKIEFLNKIDGIKGIHYHGIVGGAEKKNLFAQSHIFCLPTSLNEGQPISILEAYASGCAVIATNEGGICDIFTDKINGFEVQKKSANSLKEVIEKIIENTERLLPVAISNRIIASERYRTTIFNDSLTGIVKDIGSSLNRSGVRCNNKSMGTIGNKMEYQICANCIMDTTDHKISFDERGWCDYCRNYYDNILPNWHPNEQGEKIFVPLVDKMKKDGKGRDHDCLIGLSGGVDSSYAAYIAKEKYGLRPMLFHVDAGWNSQEAVHNIERLVDGLNLDLYTEVIDWPEMKDLQLAFFKAQVSHIDTPQDHAFFASLYNFAAKNGYKYILTGANYSTECIREPLAWHYHASDLRQIIDIHRRFGQRPLKKFPTADIFKFKIYYRLVKGVRVVKLLDYTPYIKEKAIQELAERFGWQAYDYKHYESRFTRFYEGYWLPKKFGYDKHRAHFSSLILTQQMTREEALVRIAQPAYDEKTIAQDFEYIAKKLDLSVSELQEIMDGENKTYRDYKNRKNLINFGTNVLRFAGIQKIIIR